MIFKSANAATLISSKAIQQSKLFSVQILFCQVDGAENEETTGRFGFTLLLFDLRGTTDMLSRIL